MKQDEKTAVQTDEPVSGVPVVAQPRTLIPVTLPKEHQRFYDKLRKKMESFIREKGINDTLANYLMLAPDLFVLLSRLMLDKRIPTGAKAMTGMAIAYFISPVDFLPEIITGAAGFLDDIVLTVFVLRKILLDVDEKIVLEHWSGERDLLASIKSVIGKADELIGSKVINKLNELMNSKGKGKK